MPLTDPIHRELVRRYERVRSGIAVNLPDAESFDALRQLRGGVWVAIASVTELPYEDAQFEVAVLGGNALSRELVREIHRVLMPGGTLFFSVPARRGEGEGYTQADIYNLFLKHGYDIVSLQEPAWWKIFGRQTITVCARKKNWNVQRSLVNGGTLPLNLGR